MHGASSLTKYKRMVTWSKDLLSQYLAAVLDDDTAVRIIHALSTEIVGGWGTTGNLLEDIIHGSEVFHTVQRETVEVDVTVGEGDTDGLLAGFKELLDTTLAGLVGTPTARTAAAQWPEIGKGTILVDPLEVDAGRSASQYT